MNKQYWCVRIILHRKYPKSGIAMAAPVGPPNDNMLFDDMGTRTVGLTLWLTLFEPYTKLQRNDDDGVCFDLLCPRSIRPQESGTWAHRKAQKIASFGINAVAAPEAP